MLGFALIGTGLSIHLHLATYHDESSSSLWFQESSYTVCSPHFVEHYIFIASLDDPSDTIHPYPPIPLSPLPYIVLALSIKRIAI
jgi:hypothetical protein